MKKAKKKAPQTIITSFKRDLTTASDQHLTLINSITSSINPNSGLNN